MHHSQTYTRHFESVAIDNLGYGSTVSKDVWRFVGNP